MKSKAAWFGWILCVVGGSALSAFPVTRDAEEPTTTLAVPGIADTVAWSPDGVTLAVVTHPDPQIEETKFSTTLWNSVTGRPAKSLADTMASAGAAFTPDGRTFVSAVWRWNQQRHESTSEVQVWDPAAGKLVRTLHMPTAEGLGVQFESDLLSVAISPDGQWVAACGKVVKTGSNAGEHIGGEVCLWDARTGKLRWHNRTTHTNIVRAVAFSPDSRTLVSAGQDQLVRLWNPRTGALKQTLFGVPWEGIDSISFSPDGKRLAAGGGGREAGNSVFIWDLPKGTLLRRIDGFESGLWVHVAFGPDGLLWTAGMPAHAGRRWQLRSWDVATGQPKSTLAERAGAAQSLAVSNDGKRIAVATVDRTVEVFKAGP